MKQGGREWLCVGSGCVRGAHVPRGGALVPSGAAARPGLASRGDVNSCNSNGRYIHRSVVVGTGTVVVGTGTVVVGVGLRTENAEISTHTGHQCLRVSVPPAPWPYAGAAGIAGPP